jgi:hypothetical protein
MAECTRCGIRVLHAFAVSARASAKSCHFDLRTYSLPSHIQLLHPRARLSRLGIIAANARPAPKITDLLSRGMSATEIYMRMKIGPHTVSVINASDSIIPRNVQVITPAIQAGIRAPRNLITISKNRTGLFLVAYQIYAHSNPTKVMLKLAATPATPHLIPIIKPATQIGAEINA